MSWQENIVCCVCATYPLIVLVLELFLALLDDDPSLQDALMLLLGRQLVVVHDLRLELILLDSYLGQHLLQHTLHLLQERTLGQHLLQHTLHLLQEINIGPTFAATHIAFVTGKKHWANICCNTHCICYRK